MRHPILFAAYLIAVIMFAVTAAVCTTMLLPLHGGVSGMAVTLTTVAVMLGGGLLGEKLHLAD